MSAFRELQIKLQQIEEGAFKDLDIDIQEFRRANRKLSPVQLVALARQLFGQEVATHISNELETEGDVKDYNKRNQTYFKEGEDNDDHYPADCEHCDGTGGDYLGRECHGCSGKGYNMVNPKWDDVPPLEEEDESNPQFDDILRANAYRNENGGIVTRQGPYQYTVVANDDYPATPGVDPRLPNARGDVSYDDFLKGPDFRKSDRMKKEQDADDDFWEWTGKYPALDEEDDSAFDTDTRQERIYPDTALGAIEMLGNESIWDVSSAKATPDPEVEGVWMVTNIFQGDMGGRSIVYLAGYRDPYGDVRDNNDFEDEEFLDEEDALDFDTDDYLSGGNYEMVKRVMAKRGHEPHSLGPAKNGAINARDDFSPGRPTYLISADGEVLSLTFDPKSQDCQKCDGLGSDIDFHCNACDGTGEVFDGESYGDEINPPKQGWMDKFKSLLDSTDHTNEEGVSLEEAAEKIACLKCDEVSTAKEWQKNGGSCPKCKDSTQGVAESMNEARGRVVNVPAELRGDSAMTGGATSADVQKFLADLGPDDDVSHDVVDPETGELLDWPTTGLNRNEREDDEDAAYWRKQGGTKRERGLAKYNTRPDAYDDVPSFYLHTDASGDFQEQAYELLDELRNSDFYNVVWRDSIDSVEDPEMMRDNDYDIDVEMPVLLKRKDGQKLTDADHDNIQEIMKAVKIASTMGNVGIGYAGTTVNGTTARFYPTYM